MPHYLVNERAQPTGEHEVHETTCSYLPDSSNQRPLDWHADCHSAVRAASGVGAAMAQARAQLAIAAIIGAFVGAFWGYSRGRERAFKLKLEAQVALCQVQIERNTKT